MIARALAKLAAVAALTLAAGAAPAQAADAPPDVTAPSAIVMEASTGEVLYARAAERERSIASATKLMTALLTVERTKLGEMVPASDYIAAPIESRLSLRPGERMSVADLLRGLMLESANDAAVTLAEHISGSRPAFVRLMNRRARELGLDHTHFANPIGLDEAGNYSSAYDLARLAVELRRHSFVRKIADRSAATLDTGYRTRTIRNRNTLLGDDRWVNGLKTGHTAAAGYVLVGTRTRHKVTLVSVVLGTPSLAARDQDTLALLHWGEDQYEEIRPVMIGTVVDSAAIRYRRGATVNLVTSGSVKRVVRAGADITVRDVGVPDTVTGPVSRDERLGYREVLADGKRIAAVPIVVQSFVPAADVTQRTKDWFTRPFSLVLAVGLLGCTVLVGRRLRRGPRRRPPRSEPEAA
jgi:D-alanyl-D-alanine carboxypeptidase (penicillin-binding protein 5/6)